MPANQIEQELVKATGLKKKVAEKFQSWADRLMRAVQDLPEDEWDQLSAEAQNWHTAAAKAHNNDKDIPRFPDTSSNEGEEEAEAEPKERTRGRRSDDEAAEEDPEPPARGRSRGRREEAEEEEPPARGSRTAAKDRKPEPEPKGRTSRTAAKAPAAKAGAKRTAAKAPAAAAGKPKRSGEKEGKAQSATTLLKKALIKDPGLSTQDILDMLEEKHGLTPTPMAVSSIRSAFLHSIKILHEAGHCDIDLSK